VSKAPVPAAASMAIRILIISRSTKISETSYCKRVALPRLSLRCPIRPLVLQTLARHPREAFHIVIDREPGLCRIAKRRRSSAIVLASLSGFALLRLIGAVGLAADALGRNNLLVPHKLDEPVKVLGVEPMQHNPESGL